MWVWIIRFVGSALGRVAALALGAISIISFSYMKGRKDKEMSVKSDTMKESLKAYERRDNVEKTDTVDDAIIRLRESGDVRD